MLLLCLKGSLQKYVQSDNTINMTKNSAAIVLIKFSLLLSYFHHISVVLHFLNSFFHKPTFCGYYTLIFYIRIFSSIIYYFKFFKNISKFYSNKYRYVLGNPFYFIEKGLTHRKPRKKQVPNRKSKTDFSSYTAGNFTKLRQPASASSLWTKARGKLYA